jgi:hypothetical protein
MPSWPGSMWLDAMPYAPFLRLDDKSIQNSGSICMGVRTCFSFVTCWTCPCGHTVKEDDITHALGCKPAQQSLSEPISRAGATSAPICGPPELLHPTCTPGLATFSQTSCSPIPWLLPAFVLPPAPLAMPLLYGMLTSAGTIFRTTAQGMHIVRSLLNQIGG